MRAFDLESKKQLLNLNKESGLIKWVHSLDLAILKEDAWKLNQWEELNHSYILFKSKNAFILYQENLDDWHLLKIGVEEIQRGSGFAQDFFFQSIKYLKIKKNIYLEVRQSNQRAIGFYKKLSFKKLREIKRFYKDGESALSMILELGS